MYIYIYSDRMRYTQLRAAHFDRQKATRTTGERDRETERETERRRERQRHRHISLTGPHRGPPDPCLGDNEHLDYISSAAVPPIISPFPRTFTFRFSTRTRAPPVNILICPITSATLATLRFNNFAAKWINAAAAVAPALPHPSPALKIFLFLLGFHSFP